MWFASGALLLIAATATAQDAAFVQEYAASEAVDGPGTVYLLAIASGLLEPSTSYTAESIADATVDDAARFADGSQLSVAQFSYLVSIYLDTPRGLMGTLFPGPRYAVRDLRREEILLFADDAGAPMPGEAALRTIRRALSREAQ